MERLQSKIETFLRTCAGDFESLALELYAHQFEKSSFYQAFGRAQHATPESVRRWQDIPAVPIRAFKSAELATFPVGQAAAIFESSATTTGTPSRHFLKTLTWYETSLKSHFSRVVLNDEINNTRYHFLILTPSPAEAPRSSLSWMMDVVKRTWGSPQSGYFVQRGRLDEPRLTRILRTAETSGRPVVLMGTTILFLSFLDYVVKNDQKFSLPAGSLLMDTGGMKTQKRGVSRFEFVRQVEHVLGIRENHCINEYGMCELGSQFYGRGVSSYLEGPPWTRTLVIDPTTGLPAIEAKPGLLRHYDLANVDSVMAIQTEDVGITEGSGFVFLGRDPYAELKGCSLSAEAFLT